MLFAGSHYGALQGLDKQETVKKFGKDQVAIWRRSFDIPPPPVDDASSHNPANDLKYREIPDAAKIRTESLKVLGEKKFFTVICVTIMFVIVL